MLTDSPKGIPWSEVSSPREAYRRGKMLKKLPDGGVAEGFLYCRIGPLSQRLNEGSFCRDRHPSHATLQPRHEPGSVKR